jgi:hypothetical protein
MRVLISLAAVLLRGLAGALEPPVPTLVHASVPVAGRTAFARTHRCAP